MKKFKFGITLLMLVLATMCMFACDKPSQGEGGTGEEESAYEQPTSLELKTTQIHLLENSQLDIEIIIAPDNFKDENVLVRVPNIETSISSISVVKMSGKQYLRVVSGDYLDTGRNTIGEVENNADKPFIYFEDTLYQGSSLKKYFTVEVHKRATQLSTPKDVTFNPDLQIIEWSSVENAKFYEVEISYGNNESEILTTNFNSLVLPEKFLSKRLSVKIKAVYDNVSVYPLYSSSLQSSVFEFTALKMPTNLFHSNQVISWDKVENATKYELTISSITEGGSLSSKVISINAEPITKESTRQFYTYPEFTTATSYNIKIKALGDSSLQNVFGTQDTKSIVVEKLKAPTEFKLENSVFSWAEIDKNNGYHLTAYYFDEELQEYIVHEEIDIDKNSYKIHDDALSGKYKVCVYTNGDTINTLQSYKTHDIITNKLENVTTLQVKDGKLTWQQVLNASQYSIILNNDSVNQSITIANQEGLELNSFDLSGYPSGSYSVAIIAGGDGTNFIDSNISGQITATKLIPTSVSFNKIDSLTNENSWELYWEEVEGATAYTLEINAQSILIPKDEIVKNADGKISYVIPNELSVGDYTAKVWCSATDKITSEKSNDLKFRKIGQVSNIFVKEGVLCWDTIENISNYSLKISYTKEGEDNQTVDLVNNGVQNNYTFADYDANTYFVSIEAMSNETNVISGGYSQSFECKKLEIPADPSVKEGVLSYESIPEGTLYVRETIGEKTKDYIAQNYVANSNNQTSICLFAKGDDVNLINGDVSNSITVKRVSQMRNPWISQGYLFYELPTGANKIQIKISQKGSYVYEDLIISDRSYTATGGYNLFNYEPNRYTIEFKPLCGSGGVGDGVLYLTDNRTYNLEFVKLQEVKNLKITTLPTDTITQISELKKLLDEQKLSGEDITVQTDITDFIATIDSNAFAGALQWDRVQGASSYTLKIANENITLTSKDIQYGLAGNVCYYMLPNEYSSDVIYKATVRANGTNSGTMANVAYIDGDFSQEFAQSKKIADVEKIVVKNGILNWTEVNDCYYEISYGTNESVMTKCYTIDNQFDIPSDKPAGNYIVKIRAIPLAQAFVSDYVVNNEVVKLPTPSNFEINDGKLAWSRIEVASTYTLVITQLSGEGGSYVRNCEINEIFFDIRTLLSDNSNYFTQLTGDFSITITVNGTVDSESEVSRDEYYLNSGKSTVAFTIMTSTDRIYVENGILNWEPVQGVLKQGGYILKITHKDENGGDIVEQVTLSDTFYELGSEYTPNTYYFDIQAIGNNQTYLTSEFSTYNYEAIKLTPVENARISDGKIAFDNLVGASLYKVNIQKMNGDVMEYEAEEDVQELTYWPGENYDAGEYLIKIKAIGSTSIPGSEETAKNYLSSEYSGHVTGNKITKLPATDNLYVADETFIRWSSVANAHHYFVRINYQTILQMPDGVNTSDLSIQISDDLNIDGTQYTFPAGNYYVNVQSKGGDNFLDSNYRTDNLSVLKLADVTGLSVENGIVVWDATINIPYRLALYIDDEVISYEANSKFLTTFEEGVGGRTGDKIYFYLNDKYDAGVHNIYLKNIGGNTNEENFGAITSSATQTLSVVKLNAPNEIRVDSTTSSINWEMTDNVDDLNIRYVIRLYYKDTGEQYITYEVNNSLSKVLEQINVGVYNAGITAYIYESNKEYCHSAESEFLTITMPAQPTGLKIENGVVSWNTINNVSGYILDFEFYEGVNNSLDGEKKQFTLTIDNPDTGRLSLRDFSSLDSNISHCLSTSLGKYKVRIRAFVSSSLNSTVTNYIGDLSSTLDGYYYFNMFASGKGTQENPYTITSYAQLQNIAYMPDLYYVQTEKIYIPSDATIFTPIGTEEIPFTGNYDGQEFEINKLNPKLTATSTKLYAGMFGYVGKGGVVKNVTITSLSTDYGYYIGGIAGYNDGLIYNCKVKNGAIVSLTKSINTELDINLGGIVGYNDINGVIDYCDFTGYVSAITSKEILISRVGGIAGYNSGIVMQCTTNRLTSATGENISVVGTYAGGIVGYNINTVNATGIKHENSNVPHITGSVILCNNNLNVIAYTLKSTMVTISGYAGGIVGYNVSALEDSNCATNSLSISYCSSFADVICYTVIDANMIPYAGGIAGYTGNGITSCYAIGAVYGINGENIVIESSLVYVGRLFGAKSSTLSTITNVYFNSLSASDYTHLSDEEFALISQVSYSSQNYTIGTWGVKDISYFSKANIQIDLNYELTYQYWEVNDSYATISRKTRTF